MGYAVVHTTGATRDSEFHDYITVLTRELLKRDVDLNSVPRIQDETDPHKRWLYVWADKAQAQAFADALNAYSETDQWAVRHVHAEPSLGPLFPLEIQIGQSTPGWVFVLAPWVKRYLKKQYPEVNAVARVTISPETLHDYTGTHGDLGHLADQMLTTMTGLPRSALAEFGTFFVVNPTTGETVIAPTSITPAEVGAPG